MQFLSDEWAEAYTTLLNEDPIVQKKLKRFSSYFKYEVNDRGEIAPLVIEVIKGQCTSYGPEDAFNPKDIEFRMSSDASTWKKIFKHELSIKDALNAKSFQLAGPKLKALSNKSGLEKSVDLMIDMQEVTL